MLRGLVLLPRVLHVLGLDQDLGLGVDGGQSTGAAASRAARHSLHLYFDPPCSQMLEPPHSLHWLRCLPCSQTSEPPHSLHLLRSLPCSQMPEPPHSLHLRRCLPCSQIPFPGHSLQ